jgi:diguanylate cyclase (GGDEF)-like protein/PAS domain S-box-containing protein
MSASKVARLAVLNLLLAVSYLLLARLGEFLALPLSYAILVWPPAGLAFASCIVWGGRRVWPGVLLGAFAAELTYGDTLQPVGMALAISAGSTLQAMLGARALRRVDPRLRLKDLRTIGRALAVAALACLVAASVGNAALLVNNTIGAAQLPRSFLTWWLGDWFGVVILLPLVLAFIGPHALWRRRRVQVGIPLTAALLLSGLAYHVVRNDEGLKLADEFSGQAATLLAELSRFDDANSRALRILAELVRLPEDRRPQRFLAYAAAIRREYPALRSLNWIPIFPQTDREDFEARMSRELGRPFRVAPVPGHGFSADGLVGPVSIIEPLAGNEPALGRDMLSEPVRAAAIVKAMRTGRLAASGKIQLVQDPQGPGGMLIIAPVASDGTNAAAVVTGVVDLSDLLRPLAGAGDVSWSLRDQTDGTVVSENLADPPQFSGASFLDRRGIYLQRSLRIADHELHIVLRKPYAGLASPAFPVSMLVLLIMLMTCAGMGVFTLVVSGNAEQTAKTVRDRTRQLREEIRRRDASEAALRKSEQEHRQLIEAAQEGIWVIDDHGITTLVNRRLADILGRDPPGLVGTALYDHMDDPSKAIVAAGIELRRQGGGEGHEIPLRRADGSTVWTLFSTSPLYDPQGRYSGALAMVVDITERKQAEERVRELAFFDQLTALPNRTLLLDRLRQVAAASSRSGDYGALLFIDLDNFKTLNDTLGHHMGDLLLQQVARRLVKCVREGDTVARFGGDEFVVVLASVDANKEAAATKIEGVAEKILAALNQVYLLGDIAQRSTASIGVALFRGDAVSLDDLMKQADLAMYKSKGAGRNLVHFFDPALESAVRERAALDEDLRHALEAGQFLLHYQPQVVGDRGLTGAEVLLRWRHPVRGLVPPAEFIPLAEETGLILPLGKWVLETACRQLALWAGQPDMAHLSIAVNVSPHQFRQDIVGQVLAALESSGANPNRLKLELTEGLLVQSLQETADKMFALKGKGVGFSLDDFGTGYSSLAYLKRLPLDQLKIDQSFVRDVLVDPNDAAIARTIIALAQSLGIGVIAEGVETAEQREFLADSGCHFCQGYFFSPPLPIEEFEAFARRL